MVSVCSACYSCFSWPRLLYLRSARSKRLGCWRDRPASHHSASCRGNVSRIYSEKHIDAKATKLKRRSAAVPMAAWI